MYRSIGKYVLRAERLKNYSDPQPVPTLVAALSRLGLSQTILILKELESFNTHTCMLTVYIIYLYYAFPLNINGTPANHVQVRISWIKKKICHPN